MKFRWMPGIDNIWVRFAMPVLVPAALMLFFIIVMLSRSFQREARADLMQRGRLLTVAVASLIQVDLATGNRELIAPAIQQAMREYPIVARIRILDDHHQLLASAVSRTSPHFVEEFTTPIRAQFSTADLFSSDSEPALGAPPHPNPIIVPGPILGYAEIALRPTPIATASVHELSLGIILAMLAGLGSAAAGLAMGTQLRKQLRTLIHALRRIGRGELTIELPAKSPGDLGAMERTINDMVHELRQMRGELEGRVSQRTLELQKAMERLAASDQQRQKLIARQTDMLEEERRRISVDMHDHINSNLALIQLLSNDLTAQSQRLVNAHVAPAEGARMLQSATRIHETTEKLYSVARAMVRSLRPESLDVLGLPRAVEELIDQFNAADRRCHLQFTQSPGIPPLRGPVAVTAYRLIQEALSNIVKHAGATMADVSLLMDDSSKELHLVVTDNGCGFDTSRVDSARGIGLASMRERVESADGHITIHSRPQGGTTIEAMLPVGAAAQQLPLGLKPPSSRRGTLKEEDAPQSMAATL